MQAGILKPVLLAPTLTDRGHPARSFRSAGETPAVQ
jgi:hypothetical protein